MVFRLSEKLIFPLVEYAEEDGLLAVGGDLSQERLLLAYRSGIFPWYNEGMPILWYAPHERFVLFPEKIKLSKSMRKLIDSGKYKITVNKAFKEVIEFCAAARREGQKTTWLTQEMKEAYKKLHANGYAISVEVWNGDRLAGGLYGVKLGKLFCGESMFHHEPNASKIALIYLAQKMGFTLIDCQIPTNHLSSLGAELISFYDYKLILDKIICE